MRTPTTPHHERVRGARQAPDRRPCEDEDERRLQRHDEPGNPADRQELCHDERQRELRQKNFPFDRPFRDEIREDEREHQIDEGPKRDGVIEGRADPRKTKPLRILACHPSERESEKPVVASTNAKTQTIAAPR